jgi:hypothetical protein
VDAGASGRALEDSDSYPNATLGDREAERNLTRAYSFYDRLHGNIAQCVMLTRQHRSPIHRGNLP